MREVEYEEVSSLGDMSMTTTSAYSPEPEATMSRSSLPLVSLNHVSFVCKSVSESVNFYENVLGFVLIKRPSSFKFQGAWLFNYGIGIGIHLLESQEVPVIKREINPKENHISFQCSDMKLIMQKLDAMNIKYVTRVVEEGGIQVDQLFFHDPDGYMIEICNCHNLPIILQRRNPQHGLLSEEALLMMTNFVIKDSLKISI